MYPGSPWAVWRCRSTVRSCAPTKARCPVCTRWAPAHRTSSLGTARATPAEPSSARGRSSNGAPSARGGLDGNRFEPVDRAELPGPVAPQLQLLGAVIGYGGPVGDADHDRILAAGRAPSGRASSPIRRRAPMMPRRGNTTFGLVNGMRVNATPLLTGESTFAQSATRRADPPDAATRRRSALRSVRRRGCRPVHSG